MSEVANDELQSGVRDPGHYLSSVSSSRCVRSQAMYSRAASVTRGHQDRSRLTSFRRFSAISSRPQDTTLVHVQALRRRRQFLQHVCIQVEYSTRPQDTPLVHVQECAEEAAPTAPVCTLYRYCTINYIHAHLLYKYRNVRSRQLLQHL